MYDEAIALDEKKAKNKKHNSFLILGLVFFIPLSLFLSLFVYWGYAYDDYVDFVPIHPQSDVRPRYDTLAHRFLSLEAKHLNRHGGIENLERFLSEVDARAPHNLKTRENILNSLKVINEVLNDQFFYRINTLMSHGLYSGAIDCDNLVLLYISAAEVLGYKLSYVPLPGHAIVQWSEGDSVVYWEATAKENNERTRNYLVKKYKLTDKIIEETRYLKPLNENKIISVAYHNMSVFSWINHMSKTAWLNEKARKYDADNFYAKIMHSIIRVAETQSDREIDRIRELIEKEPNESSSYALLGDLYLSLNKTDLAIEYLEKSLSLEKSYYIYHSLKHAYRKNRQYVKSFFSHINELKGRKSSFARMDYVRGH